MCDESERTKPAINPPTTPTKTWLVITHDDYFGYRLEGFETEEQAREQYARYPQGIVRWPVLLARVVEGKLL